MWSIAGRSQSLVASTLQRKAISDAVLPVASSVDLDNCVRCFSSGGKHKKFSPRRRPHKNYRPTNARAEKLKFGGVTYGSGDDMGVLPLHGRPVATQLSRQGKDIRDKDTADYDQWEREFGPKMGPAARYLRRSQDMPEETAEDAMRDMDYLTSAPGSTEELAYERRMLSEEFETPEEGKKFFKDLDDLIERQGIDDFELEPSENFIGIPEEDELKGETNFDLNNDQTTINPNQKAYGEWGELVIRVDRNIKLWRGGRIQSYRALVIGGNTNGCAGFGTGKGVDPRAAVDAASRHCKRNIFFVDRYQNCALTRDLVGKSNSCKVVIRATYTGLRGNLLCQEIMKYFGITNGTAKCVEGNRSQYNVVRATFKALCTHEDMETIAHKRGRRLLSIDRGRRLAI